MIELRQATQQDSEFAYCAKRAAFKEYAERVWAWYEYEQRELHARRFRPADFRVIRVAGTDVGVMAATTKPDCVMLDQLFLLPEHQGKGIGRRCMLLLMEEARQLGLPVRLRVLKVNPRARAFYERLGFSCIGELTTHDLMEWTPAQQPHVPAEGPAIDPSASGV